MIEKVELKDLGGVVESTGQADVGLGGLRITRGVIMDQDESVSGMIDNGFEDFAWVYECSRRSLPTLNS